MDKLNIYEGLSFDDTIIKEEYHSYYPRTNSFNLNDEIRIPINNQDIYTIPSCSYLYVEGTVTEGAEGTGTCELTNNAYAFLFDQIRYELNGVAVDRCYKPGITTTMKALLSYNDNESKLLQMAGWYPFKDDRQPTLSNQQFNACIPLKFLLGFAEDYGKIIINASQELILLRSRNDENCYINREPNGTKKATLEITKIEWHMPHVNVDDETRLKLLKTLNSNKPIYIPFRKWELHELPSLRNNKHDVWSIKTSTSLEKPRFVIIAFQTDKRDKASADASKFNHASIVNIKLHLNSDSYPYDNMNLQMNIKRYATAYRAYAAFQNTFYGRSNAQPLLDYNTYHNCPLYVIDCSKQNESLKSSTVDIRVEIETQIPFPENTVAYCLILHDNIVEYAPLTGIVKKIV